MASLRQALKSGGRRAGASSICRRLEQGLHRRRGMPAEASLHARALRSGLRRVHGGEAVLLAYFERFLRKYPGRGLPEPAASTRSLRDDVFREQERSVGVAQEGAGRASGSGVAKAEAAAAEAKAQAAAAEEAAKRAGKSGVKTCFWCGEEGHVKPECPVFLAGFAEGQEGRQLTPAGPSPADLASLAPRDPHAPRAGLGTVRRPTAPSLPGLMKGEPTPLPGWLLP